MLDLFEHIILLVTYNIPRLSNSYITDMEISSKGEMVSYYKYTRHC